jgi:YHS domain-containing protein
MKKIMTVAWLERLARHLALLTCLAILFKASGRADPAPSAILALAIVASAAHLCGMGVEEGKAEYRSQFRGKTYHFCTVRCKEFFEHNPVRYLRGSGKDLRDSRVPPPFTLDRKSSFPLRSSCKGPFFLERGALCISMRFS